MSSLDYIIWAEFTIKQDSTKQINERSSTQILDFLGDVGGFQGSLVIILFLFGEYFSSHLLNAAIASTFYSQKTKQKKTFYEGGAANKHFSPEINGDQ